MRNKVVVLISLFFLCCTAGFAYDVSPINNLQVLFRAHHVNAVNKRLAYIKQHFPVITQDLLSMTLYIPDSNKHARFTLNQDKSTNMATISHPPLSLFDIISANGFDVALSAESRNKLNQYLDALNNARGTYLSNGKLNAFEKQLMIDIFDNSMHYIKASLKKNTAERKAYQHYIHLITPALKSALEVAACDQLTQFKNQIRRWKNEYPNFDWPELRVAILGFHQPRNDYLPSQFFKKLLHEPDYERHVVFVEFQGSFYPEKETKALDKAFLLLAKSDYDQSIAKAMLNDPKALEYDILGPAAKKILKDWEL